jgi:hypothetical protein
MSRTVCVATDIEKCGSLYKHPVVSVGFYVADLETGQELQRRKFNIEVVWPNGEDYGDFEERCWTEFWVPFVPPHFVKELKENCLTADKAWRDIAEFIDSLEETYSRDRIVFVSDNASFDIANVDYNLEKYVGRRPMRYSTRGKYRSIVAADDMFDMIPQPARKMYHTGIDQIAKHDHDPINDAHYIFLQYFYAMKHKLSNIN